MGRVGTVGHSGPRSMIWVVGMDQGFPSCGAKSPSPARSSTCYMIN